MWDKAVVVECQALKAPWQEGSPLWDRSRVSGSLQDGCSGVG